MGYPLTNGRPALGGGGRWSRRRGPAGGVCGAVLGRCGSGCGGPASAGGLGTASQGMARARAACLGAGGQGRRGPCDPRHGASPPQLQPHPPPAQSWTGLTERLKSGALQTHRQPMPCEAWPAACTNQCPQEAMKESNGFGANMPVSMRQASRIGQSQRSTVTMGTQQ